MAKKGRDSAEARGLTTFGRSVASGCVTLVLLGLAFGSFPYLLAALLLGGAAFAARGLQAPRLDVTRATNTGTLRAGDPLDVALEVTNLGDPLAVSLHDKPPDTFLMSNGANFATAWLPTGEHATLGYTLKAPRRGSHGIGPLRATSYDPFFLQGALVAELGGITDVVVHPRTPQVPRIRTSTAWGRASLPGGDRATRGIRTNDFRELRAYERGDPLRAVNWKATARMSRDELRLIVNDYEVEGKKAVWVFVDASPYTVGGTTAESVFDELASGALAVSGHYIDLGHKVGLTLFGSGQTRILYPDAGELQERRIAAVLGNAEPGRSGDGVSKAVEATKAFLVREKPLVFVFTLPGRDSALGQALIQARAFATPGRRPATIVAVTPIPDDGADTPAARLVRIREMAQLKGLERQGITVMRYHPQRTSLVALLARGMLR
ncbi:MAG: DUF58 domain-containing protein [Candidatus Thermoplasmatota archaeon]